MHAGPAPNFRKRADMPEVVPRVARRAPTVRAGVRPWAVSLALALSGALTTAMCSLLAEAAGQTTSASDGVAGRRADPAATATSGTNNTLNLGEDAAGGPRTTGLIGWPNFAMNCYYVLRRPDHRGRRVLCVDTWDRPGRLGHRRAGGFLRR
jgi:hypothetical protein